MENFSDHVLNLTGCGYFSAPSVPIRPARIPDGEELVELLTGGKVFWTEKDGTERTYGCGTIFWHKGGEYTVYRTPLEDPYRCATFRFVVNSPTRPVPRIGFWSSPLDMGQFILDSRQMFHGDGLPAEPLRLYVYGTLLRQMCAVNRPAEDCPPPLKRALAVVERNLNSALTLDYLSHRCEVSKPYLFALFKRHFGVSPHRYILNAQLTRARTLLASREFSIKEIAEKCGFDTLEVFYRQFRRSCGMPPGEYRKRNSIEPRG